VLRPEAVVEAMKKAGGMTYKGPKSIYSKSGSPTTPLTPLEVIE
jgi:hypothetical protein